MGKRFIVSEQEKKMILSLYEQVSSGSTQEIKPEISGKFEFGPEGLTPYITIGLTGMGKDKIFNECMNWVKKTWKNPNEVIKMTIPNERIRIVGIEKLIWARKYNFPAEYTIEIYVKDNKLKFEVVSIFAMVDGKVSNQDYSKIKNFKSDEKYQKNFSITPTTIENFFNGLVSSLSKNFTEGNKETDW